MDLSDDDNVNALSLPRSLGQILTKRNPDRVNTLTNYTCDVVRLIRSEWWGMMCCPVQKLSLLVSMQVGAICLQITHITANLACLRWVVTPRMPTTLLTPKMISKSILTWFFLSRMIPSGLHAETRALKTMATCHKCIFSRFCTPFLTASRQGRKDLWSVNPWMVWTNRIDDLFFGFMRQKQLSRLTVIAREPCIWETCK